MNKKNYSILIVTLILLFIVTITFSEIKANTSTNNEYSIESSANALKLNDKFSVTLVLNCNEPTKSIQGKIEFSDDVEIDTEVEHPYIEEEFCTDAPDRLSNYARNENSFGFAIARKKHFNETEDQIASIGRKKVITLHLKVVGSMEKNVVIKWKNRNKDGIQELASITIPRSDIQQEQNILNSDSAENYIKNSINGEQQGTDNNQQNSNNNQSIIGDTSSKGSSDNNYSNQKEELFSGNVSTTKNNNKTNNFLPQTGENTIIIVMVFIVLIITIITYIKLRKK